MRITNAPSPFICLMNHVLQASIGNFVIYFDDIFIYTKSLNDHIECLTFVLEALRYTNYMLTLRSVVFAYIELFFLVLL